MMSPRVIIIGAVLLLFFNTSVQAGKEYQSIYQRGVEENKKGNFKEAINLYTKAIALKSNSPELFFVRGRAYRQNDQFDEAIKDFNKAIALKPSYAEAINQRGVLFIGKGDTTKAKNDFKKACDLGLKDGCANFEKIKSMQKNRN